jgi:hypothetical protein
MWAHLWARNRVRDRDRGRDRSDGEGGCISTYLCRCVAEKSEGERGRVTFKVFLLPCERKRSI